jgi:hypothetical protein
MESKEQKLVIPKDDPKMFQVLVDYMFGADAEFKSTYDYDADWESYWEFFTNYADKYDILGACVALAAPLTRFLQLDATGEIELNKLQGGFSKDRLAAVIFTYFPEGHELRATMARACIKACITNGGLWWQETEVPGFAAEVLKQMRRCKFLQQAVEENEATLRVI